MFRNKLKPIVLVGLLDLCVLAGPAMAQASATQQLVNQGNYWQDQGREDLAADAWRKLLAVDPDQPDALLGLGLIDLNQGRRGEAQRRLQQLQASHPGAPQVTRLRMALGGGGNSPLQNARRAAAAGRYVEAVQAYDQAFGEGGPPDDLALEYYQVLAGTPDGWERARDGLRRVAAVRDNPAASLALGQVLTYREPTRREGIAKLRELAGRSDVGGPARAAWRQALLWLDARAADAPLYQAFLQAQPNDREVAAKQAQLQQQATARAAQDDPGQRLLGEGFRALDAGDLATAEARFAQVLRARPRDAEASGGLGSVRLRQERFAEAGELLQRAVASNAKWRPAADTARYWQTLQEVRAMPGNGDALARVEQAVALRPQEAAGYVALGDLQGGSDPAAAERNYRKALERDAANAGALQGLIGLYGRQGRAAEASALFDRLSPAQQEKAGGAAALRATVSRARAQQALAAGDVDIARIELEDALLEQPADPWVRLDLARLYQRGGRPDQARGIMDGLLAQDDAPQALFARALYAQEQDDWAGAYASLERIPAAARDAEMAALHDTAWIHLQAAQARALMAQNRAGEAQLLLARVEASLGERLRRPAAAAALAGAYADIGSQQRALVLAQTLVAGPAPSVEDRLQYASVLLRARQDAEVAALLRQLRDAPMSAAQAGRYRDLRTGYVLRQVDALREMGNLEGAYEALAPILAQQSQDPRTIAALARLYSSAGDERQALVLYQQQLQLAPGDLDALVAAARSAAALRDMDTAERYLEAALAQSPESPEVLAAAGRIYRAAGKSRKAERYFRASLAAQARGSGQLDHGYPLASGAFAGSGGRAFNPFAGLTGPGARSAALRGDPLPMPAPAARLAAAPLPGYASAAPVEAYPRVATAVIDADGLPAPVAASAPSAAGVALPVPNPRSVPAASALPAAPSPAAAAFARPLPAPAGGGDSVLDELRGLQGQNSSSLGVAAAYRTRDGEAGLGRLDDLEVPLEGRFAMGEGKLRVALTPTILDAGSLGADYPLASRFGAGPEAALAGALTADSTPVDDLIGSSLYQTLLTRGESNATRNLIYENALDSGRYQELFNQTDGALTAAERRAAALEALYADPLPSYILGRDLANTPIGAIADQILGNAVLMRGLTAGEQAQLKALARGSAATQTPLSFQDTLYAMVANAAGARPVDSQDASGAGVSVGYEQGGFRADIGTTPLGFQESQVVGGIGYRGQAGDALTWSAEVSRRAVTDSLLSFAGVEDPRTGLQWGGVAAAGAKLAATVDNGLLGGYASLAWHRLEGENVASNDRQELGLGIYVHALETASQSLTAGLNLTAMRYDRNLSGFTYGHGGYFSPQEYVDLGFPVHWNGRGLGRRFAWQLDASAGVQHFKVDPAPYFPDDPQLQQAAYDAASMAALLGLTPEYVEPVYLGQTKTGLSYNLTGAAEWQLSSQLFLGGRMEFNNARDYRQFGANLYLRFLLDRLGAALGKQPQPIRSPFASGE
ncbi:cellulose synthase [Pseudoxanthomonas broegbernensis]|uniref:Cellulose synthase n=1 Tax=Pseudoxanthomonas broegbernensis TaxID=83619 RepID=A0A7V8GLT5_9GAMM|nr:cellulose biosynthesis protein BcsC [Pseudoxanthomonas broegbernensis]KAF1686063.1 cellulose synthase [Pseudoxanthomonas broegbernensis]